MWLPVNPFTGPEHRSFTLAGADWAVVLVHGFPGTPHELRPLARVIHAQGWSARALLLPGFGPELESLPQRRLPEWQEAICAAAEACRRSHRVLVLLGYSLGGGLVLSVAPQIRPDALILISPFTGIPHPLWHLLPLFRRLVPSLRPFRLFKPDFQDPRFRERMDSFLPGLDWGDPAVQAGLRDFRIPVALLDELRKAGRAALQAAHRTRSPALVLQGTEDETVPSHLTRRLVYTYRGPVWYREFCAGHDLPDDTQPAWPQVCRTVTAFLQEVAP